MDGEGEEEEVPGAQPDSYQARQQGAGAALGVAGPEGDAAHQRRQQAEVEAELDQVRRAQLLVALFGVEEAEGVAIGLRGALDPGEGEEGDEEDGAEGEMEAGLEQPERMREQHHQRRQRHGVGQVHLAEKQAGQQVERDHPHRALNRRPVFHQQQVEDQGREGDEGGDRLAPRSAPHQPEDKKSDHGGVQAGDHQHVVGAAPAEGLLLAVGEEAAVAEQHGAEDGVAVAMSFQGEQLVEPLQQVGAQVLNSAEDPVAAAAGELFQQEETFQRAFEKDSAAGQIPAPVEAARRAAVDRAVDAHQHFHPLAVAQLGHRLGRKLRVGGFEVAEPHPTGSLVAAPALLERFQLQLVDGEERLLFRVAAQPAGEADGFAEVDGIVFHQPVDAVGGHRLGHQPDGGAAGQKESRQGADQGEA